MQEKISVEDKKKIHLAVLLTNLDGGGAQKATARLANALVEKLARVTLLVSAGGGVVSEMLDARIQVVDFGSTRVVFTIPKIIQFLKRNRPEALLSIQTNANLSAIIARRFAGGLTRLIISERNAFTARMEAGGSMKDRMMYRFVPLLYPHADLITAVSNGVADDLGRYIKNREIITLYNPVLNENLFAQAKQNVDEPWLQSNEQLVILAVGRLEEQKDYRTLLRAFEMVKREKDARLIILGEGSERAELENLIANLGLTDAVKMPGFVKNPYAFMSRADVFVLSSVREGLPNVLIEAMACRAPVVSTDCPYGPEEILDGGRYGGLVPVGEPQVLADAILAVLRSRPDTDAAYRRALDFSVEGCAQRYLEAIEKVLNR